MTKTSFFTLTILLTLFTSSAVNDSTEDDYREQMVNFVNEIKAKAREDDSDFIIIAQNGQELVTHNGKPSGEKNLKYLDAINGIARENLFYGYPKDGRKTAPSIREPQMAMLDIAKSEGVTIMAVNYCSGPGKIRDSFRMADKNGYISFAAPDRNLDMVPSYPPSMNHSNDENVFSLSDAKNFLYVINPQQYDTKDEFIRTLELTNYDILVIDYLFHRRNPLTSGEVERLRTKANGGRRLVISYLSIGEAEDYRFYWNEQWQLSPPEWLGPENKNWKGNYPVKYWHEEWKEIIYKGEESYLSRIVRAGFDGAFLDRIDSFQYFEQL